MGARRSSRRAMFATAAVATTASLVTSLRYGSLESLLLAGSSAALVGGSLARLGGAGTIALSIVAARWSHACRVGR